MLRKSPRGASAPRRSDEANHRNGDPPLPAAPGPSTRRTPLASSFADPNGQPLAYVYSRRNGGLERRPVRDDARQ